MNPFVAPVASMAAPPTAAFAIDAAGALAPAGIALHVLLVLGAIVLLVAGGTRRPTADPRRRWPRLRAPSALGAAFDGLRSVCAGRAGRRAPAQPCRQQS
jgi:hypothetical protein